MPSVGMIRSTRVFVPKSPSSTSSLSVRNTNKLDRSGGSLEPKRRIKVEESDWFNNFTTSNKVISNQQYESLLMEFSKDTQSSSMVVDVKKEVMLISETEFNEAKRFGNVYCRKRRKLNSQVAMKVERGGFCKEERMFGKHFVRKQRRKLRFKELNSSEEVVEIVPLEDSLQQPVKESVKVHKRVVFLAFVIDATTALYAVYQFLNSILGYMGKKNARLRLSLLAAFMNDQNISRVFSQLAGIHLLQDSLSSSAASGICRIQRSRNNVPIFCVDFSAIPFLFMRLHCSISLEFQRLPECLQTYLNDDDVDGNLGSGDSSEKTSGDDSSQKTKVDEINGGNELCLSFPEKKRSCSKRVNINPLSTVFYSDILNSDGAFFASSDDWISSAVSNCEPKQNKRKTPMTCHLNTEADILDSEGAFFTSSDSWIPSAVSNCEPKQKKESSVMGHLNWEADFGNDWVPLLLVPKHKKRKLSSENPTYDPSSELKVGDLMRILKKAMAKPTPTPVVKKPIPVPVVREVPDYVSRDYVPFVQPGVYLTMENDEVKNALNRKVATYDADSGDEEWLGKLSNAHHGESSLSLEKFEEMIDAFEKAVFERQFKGQKNKINESYNEKIAAALFSDTGANLVVDVYKYWLKKRKGSHLLRVFKTAKKKDGKTKAPDQPVRKPRSVRKKSERLGRGIHRHFMQEFDPDFVPELVPEFDPEFDPVKERYESRRIKKEKDDEARRIKKEKDDEARRIKKEKERVAQEEKMRKAREDDLRKSEQADILRVEQATKAADEKLEKALQKRQRAQTLMEYADLAAEWATMALKIAQATRISGSSELAASSYLDD